MKECNWYWDGFCCKDLDAGRAWDCTCKDQEERSKYSGLEQLECPYPKLGKD